MRAGDRYPFWGRSPGPSTASRTGCGVGAHPPRAGRGGPVSAPPRSLRRPRKQCALRWPRFVEGPQLPDGLPPQPPRRHGGRRAPCGHVAEHACGGRQDGVGEGVRLALRRPTRLSAAQPGVLSAAGLSRTSPRLQVRAPQVPDVRLGIPGRQLAEPIGHAYRTGGLVNRSVTVLSAPVISTARRTWPRPRTALPVAAVGRTTVSGVRSAGAGSAGAGSRMVTPAGTSWPGAAAVSAPAGRYAARWGRREVSGNALPTSSTRWPKHGPAVSG